MDSKQRANLRANLADPSLKIGGGKGTEMKRAIAALAEGKHVTLKTKAQAATLVTKLGQAANRAAAKGDKAPDFDLCKVSVPGTNLFCGQSKNIPRAQMPQFSGKPQPDSPADKLPKNANGEVDGTKAFAAHMRAQGVKVTDKTVPASELKASQNQLVGPKIAGMVNNKAFKPEDEAIFVSRDGYVIDGHHRWAAQIARDLKDGKSGDLKLKVQVVDMDILDVLKESNKWATEFGIKAKAATNDPQK